MVEKVIEVVVPLSPPHMVVVGERWEICGVMQNNDAEAAYFSLLLKFEIPIRYAAFNLLRSSLQKNDHNSKTFKIMYDII